MKEEDGVAPHLNGPWTPEAKQGAGARSSFFALALALTLANDFGNWVWLWPWLKDSAGEQNSGRKFDTAVIPFLVF